MMSAEDALPGDVAELRVHPWPGGSFDNLDHDPRSWYVEHFWLPTIGPTTLLLMRRIGEGFEVQPAGFTLDVEELARSLGLGGRSGRNSPLRRALQRCVAFELAKRPYPQVLVVRRAFPDLPLRYIGRLPQSLQSLHRRWVAGRPRRQRVSCGDQLTGRSDLGDIHSR